MRIHLILIMAGIALLLIACAPIQQKPAQDHANQLKGAVWASHAPYRPAPSNVVLGHSTPSKGNN